MGPLLVVAVGGVGFGVLDAVIVLGSEVVPAPGPTVVVGLAVGWSFLLVGLHAWWRRPDNAFGRLLAAVPFAWFAAGLAASDGPVLHTVGLACAGVSYAVLVHLLLAFPSGRVSAPIDRVVLALAYLAATVGQVLTLLFSRPAGARNLLLVREDETLAAVAAGGTQGVGTAVVLALAYRLVGRWRAAGRTGRRGLAPVLAAGLLVSALLAAALVAGLLDRDAGAASGPGAAAAVGLVAVPYAFLAGLARTRFFAVRAVTVLLAALDGPGRSRGMQAVLADALDDPDLEVAYRLPDADGHVDAAGRPVPVPRPGRAVTPVGRDGRPIGVLLHDPALAADPELVATVVAVAAIALDNERLEAALRARVLELELSRRRLVSAGEAERRRLERDLHDGAQQRLVALRMTLGLARDRLGPDPAAAGRLIDDARDGLDAALSDLRDLARGLHPAVLATHGLPAALAALADRSAVPVELVDVPTRRLPAVVESTTYFLVAEALTNVAKHAPGTSAQVRVHCCDDERGPRLRVEVRDGGPGGADPGAPGLAGLAARVAALDGRLTVTSPPGGGTLVRADLPLPGPAADPLALGQGA